MKKRNKTTEIIKGMGWLLLCHTGLVALAVLLIHLYAPVGISVFQVVLAIGLAQLLYVIPLCLRFRRRRRFSALKGVVLGAIITVVLSEIFYIILFNQLVGIQVVD